MKRINNLLFEIQNLNNFLFLWQNIKVNHNYKGSLIQHEYIKSRANEKTREIKVFFDMSFIHD